MDIKNFTAAISQIAEEKGISAEKVLETIEMAIAAAYKKDYGKKGQIIKAKLDPNSGEVKFWQIKSVVTKDMIYSEEELAALREGEPRPEASGREEAKEDGAVGEKIRFNPEKHIMLKDAQEIDSAIKAGEDLEMALETKKDYGRIAAQTAKQVILQRIREAERASVLQEFRSKEGEIISGVIQRIEGRNIFIDIGKTLGLLTREEQVPGEFYRPGQRLKVYVLKVEETPKGPVVFLSRAYPKIISKLFELEVPEIGSGQVQIRSIAREVGSRSKIAVESLQEGIDPIGAMVGQRGTRVSAVISELGGEKIDIIAYSEDPEKYLANSLSPAKVLEVKILPRNKAQVIVPLEQLSLAIGKEGQNVRLAAKLTGWKIDVKSPAETEEELSREDSEPESPEPLKEPEKTSEAAEPKEEKPAKKKKSKKKESE